MESAHLGVESESTEFYCVGHFTSRCGRCNSCKSDEKNRECPDYKAVKFKFFKVQEPEQAANTENRDFI